MLKGNFGSLDFQHKRNLNSSLFGVEFKIYIIRDIKFLYILCNQTIEIKVEFELLSSPSFSPPNQISPKCHGGRRLLVY